MPPSLSHQDPCWLVELARVECTTTSSRSTNSRKAMLSDASIAYARCLSFSVELAMIQGDVCTAMRRARQCLEALKRAIDNQTIERDVNAYYHLYHSTEVTVDGVGIVCSEFREWKAVTTLLAPVSSLLDFVVYWDEDIGIFFSTVESELTLDTLKRPAHVFFEKMRDDWASHFDSVFKLCTVDMIEIASIIHEIEPNGYFRVSRLRKRYDYLICERLLRKIGKTSLILASDRLRAHLGFAE
uniref:Uncharacterized protein n=1 Tax=Rhizoctonia cerealis phyllomonavirus TaxID=3068671 RepID=A0AA51BSC2_9MONO|nr:MAG: hypothetical protein [Rhizoctonia cerealis phyllomonavirus]